MPLSGWDIHRAASRTKKITFKHRGRGDTGVYPKANHLGYRVRMLASVVEPPFADDGSFTRHDVYLYPLENI
jgi:hypothetical protein